MWLRLLPDPEEQIREWRSRYPASVATSIVLFAAPLLKFNGTYEILHLYSSELNTNPDSNLG